MEIVASLRKGRCNDSVISETGLGFISKRREENRRAKDSFFFNNVQ